MERLFGPLLLNPEEGMTQTRVEFGGGGAVIVSYSFSKTISRDNIMVYKMTIIAVNVIQQI